MADRVASTAVVRLRSRASVLLAVTSVVGLVGFALAAVPARQLVGRPGPLGGRPVDLHRRAAPAPRRRAERAGRGVARRQGHRPARHPGRLRRGTADPEPRCGRIRAGVLPAHPRRPRHGPGLRLRARRADPGRLGPHHGRGGTLAALPDVRGGLARLRCRLPSADEGQGRGLAPGRLCRRSPACSTARSSTSTSGRSARGRTPASRSSPAPGMLHNLHSFVLFDLTTSLGFDIPRALTNAALVLLLGRPVLAALRRASRRAAFGAPVVLEPVGHRAGLAGGPAGRVRGRSPADPHSATGSTVPGDGPRGPCARGDVHSLSTPETTGRPTQGWRRRRPCRSTHEEALAQVTGPGQLFEVVPLEVGGRAVRVFKNAPANLGQLFAGARGDESEFLVYEDERWTFDGTMRNVDALAHALVNDYGIGQGRPGGDRHAQPARVDRLVRRHPVGRCRLGLPQRLVDRVRARLRHRGLRAVAAHRRS